MKQKENTMTMPGWHRQSNQGLETNYIQEFDEREDNEENNFYSFSGDNQNDPGEDRSE